MTIRVYAIGTEVKVGEHVAGRVLRIQIAPGNPGFNVLYEVGYFTMGGDWREIWFNGFMVEAVEAARHHIGFMP